MVSAGDVGVCRGCGYVQGMWVCAGMCVCAVDAGVWGRCWCAQSMLWPPPITWCVQSPPAYHLVQTGITCRQHRWWCGHMVCAAYHLARAGISDLVSEAGSSPAGLCTHPRRDVFSSAVVRCFRDSRAERMAHSLQQAHSFRACCSASRGIGGSLPHLRS